MRIYSGVRKLLTVKPPQKVLFQVIVATWETSDGIFVCTRHTQWYPGRKPHYLILWQKYVCHTKPASVNKSGIKAVLFRVPVESSEGYCHYQLACMDDFNKNYVKLTNVQKNVLSYEI